VATIFVSFVAFCGWSGSWPGRAKFSFRVFRLLRGYIPGSVAWPSIAAGLESVPEIFEWMNWRWPRRSSESRLRDGMAGQAPGAERQSVREPPVCRHAIRPARVKTSSRPGIKTLPMVSWKRTPFSTTPPAGDRFVLRDRTSAHGTNAQRNVANLKHHLSNQTTVFQLT
jgi:hypothetical protein